MIDWDLVTGPCMAVFGEPAEYSVPGQLPVMITGVFDSAYVEVTPLGDLGHEIGIPNDINSAMPVIGVQLSQLAILGIVPRQEDRIRMPAVLGKRPFDLFFRVQNVEDDGHGWALLKLLRVNAVPAVV